MIRSNQRTGFNKIAIFYESGSNPVSMVLQFEARPGNVHLQLYPNIIQVPGHFQIDLKRSRYWCQQQNSIGYYDEKSFRNIFRKYSGLSPLDYRKKYNRELVFAENYYTNTNY